MKSRFNDLKDSSNEYAEKFHRILMEYEIDFATGIPCGVQRHIIYNLSHDPRIKHIISTRESEAIGIAAGAYLSGKHPIVYMQNSGLFASSNDIASLLIPYKIPILLSVSWRGCVGETAPQHFVTGKSTIPLLESMNIHYQILEKDEIEKQLISSFDFMKDEKIPSVILIRRGWYL